MQTGRFRTAQVIPERLFLDLMIVLGTLAPKTNLRQMWARNKLAPDGGPETNLRQMGKNKLAPDGGGTRNKLAPDGAKTNLRQIREK